MLNKRLNDTTLKILVGILLFLMLFPVYFMWISLSDFQNKTDEIVNQEKVAVINNTGDVVIRSLEANKIDVITSLALSIVKKQFNYDYLNYKNNLEYFKQFSSKKAYNKWLKQFQKNNEDIKIVKTSYKSLIRNYSLIYNKDKKIFIFYAILEQYKTSAISNNMSNKILLKYNIVEGYPTELNSLGIYVNDYEIQDLKNVDKNTLEKIFGKG